MKKSFILFLTFFSVIIFFYFLPTAKTQEITCDKLTVAIVFRGDNGEFIPNLSFEIYEEVPDVDGNPKPGAKVAGGKTSAYTGAGIVSFKPNLDKTYLIKSWDKNASIGEFYFFNAFTVPYCDGEAEVETTNYLSGLKVVLRDVDDKLIKNYNVKIYTQREDVDGDPIREKQDFITTINTSEEGEALIYLASDNRTLAGDIGGRYIVSLAGPSGGEYTIYDIVPVDGQVYDLNYVFSKAVFMLKDYQNNNFPSGIKIDFYNQTEDSDGENIVGSLIKTLITDDSGMAEIEYPPGVYAIRIKDGDGKYYYFWDIEIVEEDIVSKTLATPENWVLDNNTCTDKSKLEVIIRNEYAEYIEGYNVELYVRETDIDGKRQAGAKVLGAKTSSLGKASLEFNPDPRKLYLLKVYGTNPSVGAFWYFDDIKFTCGQNLTSEKKLSSIYFVVRDSQGKLIKNKDINLYRQKFDIDGQPMKAKGELVAKLNTGDEGKALIYISRQDENNIKNLYVFTLVNDHKGEYEVYDIYVEEGRNYNFEYRLSDLKISIKDANGKERADYSFDIYKQKLDTKGKYTLDTILKTVKTDTSGDYIFEYPPGKYALRLKDDLGQFFQYYNIKLESNQRIDKEIKTNLTRIYARDDANNALSEGTNVIIYSLKKDGDYYFKEKALKTIKTTNKGYAEIFLAPNPYLFAISFNKKEYAKASYIGYGNLDMININVNDNTEIVSTSKFKLSEINLASSKAEKLKGYILLQVEERGEAWYVNPGTLTRYYLKDGEAAYEALRNFGLGITNADLAKIPMGIDERFEEFDYDGDAVPDKMEEAIGTEMDNYDTDGDGYNDGLEIMNDFNPKGEGALNYNYDFAKSLSGKILLQVESRGEAWYVNPVNNRRYYMKDGISAYEIMRFLSLGITNADLSDIEEY